MRLYRKILVYCMTKCKKQPLDRVAILPVLLYTKLILQQSSTQAKAE